MSQLQIRDLEVLNYNSTITPVDRTRSEQLSSLFLGSVDVLNTGVINGQAIGN